MRHLLSSLALLAVLAPAAAYAQPAAGDYFAIRVVDEATGRGVPMVELRTVNEIRYVTDSNGLVAFYEPGLMDLNVFFSVFSHGYDHPRDGFGMTGRALKTTPGETGTITVQRRNVAERLYRITGQGVYRDTLLLGLEPPIRQPAINGLVVGQDSTLNIIYQDKLWWFWGDTARPGYPLGNFHMSAATSDLPDAGGLAPSVGVDLEYLINPETGFSLPVCEMPGEGPTWSGAFVELADAEGRRRLYCAYAKIRNMLEVYERGWAVFNEETQTFEHVASFPPSGPLFPDAHVFHQTDADGVEWIHFAASWPLVRVRATAEDFLDLSRYEGYTPLKEDSTLDDPQMDRDADGRLRYGWKRATPIVRLPQQRRLIENGHMAAHEALIQLRDIETGETMQPHHGSVYYNAYRGRWVFLFSREHGQSSYLGEVGYAEADSPAGPWVYARSIITHDKYTFYNPKQHPYFDEDGGRVIYLEGTYSKTFSAAPVATPRYDYNQIMYRLDLGDERMVLPVAVYGGDDGGAWTTAAALDGEPDWRDIAFYGLDRPRPDALALMRDGDGRLTTTPVADLADGAEPLCYALSADSDAPATITLWVDADASGAQVVALGDRPSDNARALCRVWESPFRK